MRRASLSWVGLGATIVLGAAAAEAADPSPARLRKAIEPVVSRPELASAFWGIEVRSLARGRTLYALNATKAFRPASTLKLVTTAAALDAHGPEARIRTTLETAARIDGLGRLLGDVYLVGRGDPNLSGRFSDGRATVAFEAMAEALVAAGVRRIEGRLVGHEGAFVGDRRGSSWTWEDLAWGYGAEVSALSFADNLVEAKLVPGERVGDPAQLTLAPDAGCLNVVSSVTTAAARAPAQDEAATIGNGGNGLTLLREPGSNDVRLTGALPLAGEWKERLAVADPASCAAAVFSSVLEARGVRVTGGVATSREALPAGSRVLAAYEGQPMAEIIRVVNTESQNLHAEMLLRLVGLKLAGEGSAKAGHEAVRGVLKRLGVDDTGWSLADGSGLARTNLLTPHGVVTLLAAMDRHPHAAAFRDSLAIAGATGTLEKRLRGTPAEKRLVGKTGSFQLASSLAGYVTTMRGERLAFAIFLNNQATRGREATGAIDRVAALLAEAR